MTGYKINVLNIFTIMATTMWKCQKKMHLQQLENEKTT